MLLRKTQFIVIIILLLYAIGCNSMEKSLPSLPSTMAENETSFSYIPLDPLPIDMPPKLNCIQNDTTNNDVGYEDIDYLSYLPDQAVRLAVGKFDASGTLSFGPQTFGIEKNSYQVVIDYISVDAIPIPITIERIVTSGPNVHDRVSIYDSSITDTTRYRVSNVDRTSFLDNRSEIEEYEELVVIPVYIGVGLRLTATVNVLKGRVNLSSLASLAAEAEAENISGSLVVQTLGITGNNVSKTLPIPTELNQTTIQNAILSLGAIKALLYDSCFLSVLMSALSNRHCGRKF